MRRSVKWGGVGMSPLPAAYETWQSAETNEVQGSEK
jgi:hypothetical protein